MANESAYGGAAGTAAGALIGSFLFPGLGTAAGAAIGGGLGGSLGSLFGGGGTKAPDISGELANLSSLFAQARAAARVGIEADYNRSSGQAASNLAARGTYRSPVAENTFSALRQARTQAIGQSEGQLAGQEAQLRGSLLERLLGVNLGIGQLKDQRESALYGQLGGLGGGLLTSILNKNAPGPTPVEELLQRINKANGTNLFDTTNYRNGNLVSSTPFATKGMF